MEWISYIPLTYRDKRGWKYKVRPGLGGGPFKGMYQKPGQRGWHSIRSLPWRDSPVQAQRDLDKYAKKKKLKLEVCSDE